MGRPSFFTAEKCSFFSLVLYARIFYAGYLNGRRMKCQDSEPRPDRGAGSVESEDVGSFIGETVYEKMYTLHVMI